MHSRIFEIGKEPIQPAERLAVDTIPEWFFEAIADYASANTNREADIKWFVGELANVIEASEDGESFSFLPDGKLSYFRRKFNTFLEQANILTGISLEAFAGETKFEIDMAMYRLNAAYDDNFELYIYIDGTLITVDSWIRSGKLNGSFYFGGTIDFHY